MIEMYTILLCLGRRSVPGRYLHLHLRLFTGTLTLMILRPEHDLIFADRELEVDENQHSFWGTLCWFAGLYYQLLTGRIHHRIIRFPIVFLFDSCREPFPDL